MTESLVKCTTGSPVILTEGTSLKLTENRRNDYDVSRVREDMFTDWSVTFTARYC